MMSVSLAAHRQRSVRHLAGVTLGEAGFLWAGFLGVRRNVSGRYAAPPRDTVQHPLAAAGEAGGEGG
jgi:hypothetical protein